jgi:hypothetical protein
MKTIFLFIASVLLTAVFSYSLNIFLKEDFITLTLKTMLIPCFTWSGLLIFAWVKLKGETRRRYFYIASGVCALGSAALVPGGLYNFIATDPDVKWSVASVIICVLLMSGLFYSWLKNNNFSLSWWLAYNVLIVVNMGLFYLSTLA